MKGMALAGRLAGALALFAVLPGGSASAAAPEIRHEAVTCVALERYARVTASASPAEAVARVDLQFRASPDGEWYSVAMAGEKGTWSAMLPRPIRPLARFEYRVAVVGADLSTTATPPVTVRVADDPAGCEGGAAGEMALPAPIVVRVPQGAPLVPPVPAGFSPTGVVAAAGPKPKDRWGAVKWAGGAVVAGTIGAIAAGAGSGAPPPPLVSDFRFFGIQPNPGSDLSITRDRVSVFVQVTGEPSAPLTFTWVLGLKGAAQVGRDACITMTDTTAIGPGRPLTVELSAPLRITNFCGVGFDVTHLQLTIVVDGQVVHDLTEPVTFHVRP